MYLKNTQQTPASVHVAIIYSTTRDFFYILLIFSYL